jgi:alanine racemase
VIVEDAPRVKSWIEIAQTRHRENVQAVRVAAGADAELLAVIKANGYGHDAALIAPVLAAAGVTWLGVGDAEEGARVRRALGGRAARLLVMCGMEPDDAAEMVEHELTPVVWTAAHLRALEDAAAHAGVTAAVHLEIDSGMARQGVTPGAELRAFVGALRAAKHIEVEGLMSHLSSSEVAGSAVTARPRERFGEAIEQVVAAGVRPGLLHLANSSALDEGSTTEWMQETAAAMGARVLVRPGIAMYGYCVAREGESRAGELAARVRPVLMWKTRVIGTRSIAAGETVGYGATFVAERAMRLALLPVGYADGLRREASSGIGDGWVMITGERAPVVGRVSMNLTVVDVTAMADVGVGAEATLLGEGVSAEDHARWWGTIPYEILCGIRAQARLV